MLKNCTNKLFQGKYSYLSNRFVWTLIAGKVCLLHSIKFKRQTLQTIGVHAHILPR